MHNYFKDTNDFEIPQEAYALAYYCDKYIMPSSLESALVSYIFATSQ